MTEKALEAILANLATRVGADETPTITSAGRLIGTPAIDIPNLSDTVLFDPDLYSYASGNSGGGGGGAGEKERDKTVFSYFTVEGKMITKLDGGWRMEEEEEEESDILKTGKELLSRLYSYRHCGQAIPQTHIPISTLSPQVQAMKPDCSAEYYKRVHEILQPEIQKMLQFMNFRDSANKIVTEVFSVIITEVASNPSDVFCSDNFLLNLAAILDLYVVLDAMKNIKGSMNNDLSQYKRATSLMRQAMLSANQPLDPKQNLMDDETTMKLYLFLGNQDQFSIELKKGLQAVTGYEDLIQEMIGTCADYIESEQYLLPDTKHSYLKADITKRKRFRLDRLAKLFRTVPVVPLFGDMPITLSTIYAKAPHLGSKWQAVDMSEKAAFEKSYKIVNSLEATRNSYHEYLTTFGKTTNMLRKVLEQKGCFSFDEYERIYEILFEGIRLLCACTTNVLEQSAWKYANPTSSAINMDIPPTAIDYELVVKYNYSPKERRALIEYIAIIKKLSSLFLSLDDYMIEGIQRHLYSAFQGFMKYNMADYIAHATKKKRSIANVLKVVRELSVDGLSDEAAKSPSKTMPVINPRNRKEPFSLTQVRESHQAQMPFLSAALVVDEICSQRTNHPLCAHYRSALAQLHYARTLMGFAFSEKSKGMKGGLLKEKDFKESHVDEMQDFFYKSYYFPHMIDFKGTVESCSDLSDLWYKEFYLEMSKKVQFPISMSLPWILTESILDGLHPEAIGYLFFAFDVYNDAANRALHRLKCKFIYDEIVAEVNLCFDQLIFHVSEHIYSHFKRFASRLVSPVLPLEPSIVVAEFDLASRIAGLTIVSLAFSNTSSLDDSMLLPIEFRNKMDAWSRHSYQGSKETPLDCYNNILRQRHFQLFAEQMNQQLRKSIDIAIGRYESSTMHMVIELEHLLKVIKETHRLLSQHLTLDSFEDMLMEVDETVSLTKVNGRILTHTVSQIIEDVAPNSVYNMHSRRFMRKEGTMAPSKPQQKVSHSHMYGSKSIGSLLGAHFALYRGYLGDAHFQAIARLIGIKGVAVLLGEITYHAEQLLSTQVSAFVLVFQKGAAQTVKLPMLEYGVVGAYGYFAAHFGPIIQYPDLHSLVLNGFRSFGNLALLLQCMDDAMQSEKCLGRVLLGLFSTQTASGAADVLDQLVQDGDAQHSRESLPMSFGDWKKRVDTIAGYEGAGHLFRKFLEDLRKTLAHTNEDWKISDAQGHLNNPKAFYKIWCAIHFAFLLAPEEESVDSPRDLFGDGVLWAGSIIMQLLDQVELFRALDPSHHVLRVFKHESRTKDQPGQPAKDMKDKLPPSVRQFLRAAQLDQILEDEIFDVLGRATATA
ncbi:cytoplasmic fragile-X interacting family-domain-containing protein [Polychytrium aggregatum]|uniref:cytoplasmic fragile-X interacting family-domain-containing protein n=1 Tax=Polychytrium aggregatum TaxID=110093 RepID=UPI0022FED3FE|nr:cytoplasmic fragile-X interacting family-domain-containing protein [Polychytrium aggregatum]KAI9208741.1 cytoplasmic fragile-X interacting family-domain-containing protein [Polychytrium aggregatum]